MKAKGAFIIMRLLILIMMLTGPVRILQEQLLRAGGAAVRDRGADRKVPGPPPETFYDSGAPSAFR